MDLEDPPFETVDQNGKPTGINVDIAEALGRYLNRPIVIENIPFMRLIPALQSGKIDIIASISPTQERKELISFSDPYFSVGLALLIAKKSDLQNIKEANQPNRTIVVKHATTGEIWADEYLTKANIKVLNKESACIQEVATGKADAFIYDQLSVYSAWKKNPKTTRVNLRSFFDQAWAMGLRKEDLALKEQINAFIKKFREEKGFAAIGDKYLKNEKAEFQKLGIPFPLQ